MEFVSFLLIALFIGSAVVALIFWNEILDWANKALYPWIRKYLPELEFDIRNAFAALDKVVTPIRNNIRALNNFTEIQKAWKMLREYLLKVVVQFEQKTPNQWVKRIIYWAIRNLNSKEVVRTVAEEIVDADSLQSDVREEWVKKGNTNRDVDVTEVRDQELLDLKRKLTMTN